MVHGLNFDEEVLALKRRKPFQSFVVVLENGDRHMVTEGCRIGWGESTVVVYKEGTGFCYFKKQMVKEIETPEFLAKRGGLKPTLQRQSDL